MIVMDTPLSLDAAVQVPHDVPECQSWLNPFRDANRTLFQRLGFPTRRNESWRFTNVDAIARTNFVAPSGETTVAPDTVRRFDIPGLDAVTLVFVDGVFKPHLSDDVAELGEGVTCCKLTDAICQHRAQVEPYIGKLTGETDDAFTALNNADIETGVFLHVAKGVRAAKPVHILSIATKTAEPVAAHPRNLIVVEEAGLAEVLEHYVTADDDAVYFNNAVTELFAADHARVDHYLLERESEAAFNISTLAIRQGVKSDVHSHTVLLGGRIVRNNVLPTLAGENGHCLINGLYVGHEQQHLDNAMRVHHAAPGCQSRQYYKGILNDKARGVFTGRIVVDPAGQQTDAVQSNRNMLLSGDARVNARPQLEIYADDVKCTHGATTGEVDEEAVFYFRSRGIPEPVARAMLIYAFAAEGFDRMELVPVRQLLAREMIDKLPMARGLSIEV